MRKEVTSQTGQVSGGGKEDRAEGVDAKQKDGEKKAHGSDSRREKSAALNREGREHEDVEQVGEKEVPDEDRDRSDGHKGIHDVEVVVGYLRPEGTPSGKVIWREEIDCHTRTRQRDRVGNLERAGLGLFFTIAGFALEEAREKVAQKDLKRSALRLLIGVDAGLHGEREYGVLGFGEELQGLKHWSPA